MAITNSNAALDFSRDIPDEPTDEEDTMLLELLGGVLSTMRSVQSSNLQLLEKLDRLSQSTTTLYQNTLALQQTVCVQSASPIDVISSE